MIKSRYVPWSEEDKQFLIDNWETMTDVEMAKVLGREVKAVKATRYRLHLAHPQRIVTDKEIDFIKVNTGKLTYRQMAKELNRPLPTIYSAAGRIYPKRSKENEKLWGRYTEDEVRFLEVNVKSMSIFELAEILNKTPKSIVSKLLREGLLGVEE